MVSKILNSILISVCLAMITSCQSTPPLADDDPVLNNDKNIVMNSCRTNVDRGVQVCTFNRGSKIESNVTLFVPWERGYSGTAKIRFYDKFIVKNISSNFVDFSYKELMESEVWTDEQDGIIQVVINIDKNGKVFRALGYIYTVVVNEGYNPYPLFWTDVRKTATCHVYYSESGKSVLSCN